MSALRLAVGFAVFVTVLAAPFLAYSSSSQPPAQFSGHIVDGSAVRTCTACHSTFALNSGGGGVAIEAPESVAPGQTVPITIRLTSPQTATTRRQGFLATVRNHAEPLPPNEGAFVGTLTLTDPVNTGRPSGGSASYVGHTATGTSQTAWTFGWTAPATAGPATVYVAANAANGADASENDYIYTAHTTINVMAVADEEHPVAPPWTLGAPSPNPVRSTATVRLTLATPAVVAVQVVDGRGRVVRTVAPKATPAGTHALRVSAAGLAPGTYFVVVEAGGARQTRPFVVTR